MELVNYNLKVNSENIDLVLLKLCQFDEIEIRDIKRLSGFIKIKAKTLEKISAISEILKVEKDKKIYINHIAIL